MVMKDMTMKTILNQITFSYQFAMGNWDIRQTRIIRIVYERFGERFCSAEASHQPLKQFLCNPIIQDLLRPTSSVVIERLTNYKT